MKIGLIDFERTHQGRRRIVNYAYMQIAAWHRQCGDSVEWWAPLADRLFDCLYCSSLFTYSNKSQVPGRAVCGGTGFDPASRLSVAMEQCDPDYSLYPECDYSMVWFSRGCIRNCPFCVVWQKEGPIRTVVPKKQNPKAKYIKVMDNNFFANPEWRYAIWVLQQLARPVDFQGVDARLLDKKKCEALLTLKHYKQVKIAWDDPKDDTVFCRLQEITKYIRPWRLMCYVLIGFWSDAAEDLERVMKLRELGIDPYVMPYDKRSLYQRTFARWVNHKGLLAKIDWPGYWRRIQKQETDGTGRKGRYE